uniref:hypothetical protein n=1 Tax=Microbulbifer agarilyticus TaxID=260552 RepID=UPI0002558E32|nr:hypothetical protein [Microbulbifer agarilyticus]
MLLRNFNKVWEKERDIIETQLIEKMNQSINEIDFSMSQQAGRMVKEAEDHLRQMRNELVTRKSMAVYEAEEIARNRMQLRASYLALVMSSVALIISIATVLAKL